MRPEQLGEPTVSEGTAFRDRTIEVACTEESVLTLLAEQSNLPAAEGTVVDAPDACPPTTDCLVVTDPSDVLDEQSPPTVLFTRADPMDIGREALTAVGTIVQRERSDSAERLAEKIRTVTSDPVSAAHVADSHALTPPVVAFIVTPDGTVEWSSHDPAAVFADEQDDARPDSLYEWVSQSLAVSGQSVTELLELSDSPAERTGGLVTVPGPDGHRQYRHDSYELPSGNRLELFEDVTAELAQQDRLDRLTELVENTQDGLFVLDTDGAVSLCNQSLADALGAEQSALEGRHASTLFPDHAYPSVRERLRSGLAADRDGVVIDTALETSDGDSFDAEISLSIRRDADGRYGGVLGVVRDISARNQRQQELKRYGAIIEAVGSPLCTLDETGQLRYVNQQFREQFGADTLDLIGEPLDQLLGDTEAQRVQAALDRVIDGDRDATESLEVEITPQSGPPVPTECRLALLPPTTEDTDAVVAVFHDITRLKEREQRLSKFASVVSHDLRNPMDVALGRAEMLPEIADVDPQTEHHLDDIYESLKRMERLIQDVLTLTRQRDEGVETKPVALSDVAQAAWDNVSTEESELRVEAELEIAAHRGRLLRLFENLFRNAIQHAGPEVTVRVEPLETATKTGFRVSDNGPGIPKNHRDQIFEDGFTTDGEGTGLGLAIVREISHAHDWEVTLAETTGGAQFEFRDVLPADD